MCVTSGQSHVRVVRLPSTLTALIWEACIDMQVQHGALTWRTTFLVSLLTQQQSLCKQKGEFSFVKPLRFEECWFLQHRLFDSTTTKASGKDVSSMRVKPLTTPCHTPFAQERHELLPYILWVVVTVVVDLDSERNFQLLRNYQRIIKELPMPLAEELTWGGILNKWKLN